MSQCSTRHPLSELMHIHPELQTMLTIQPQHIEPTCMRYQTSTIFTIQPHTQQEGEEEETEDLPDSFKDFVNTGIAFNLNFIRPSFFGQEAFNFVETFINDLDLFVMHPQGDDDLPSKPSKKFLFENWNKTKI